MAKVLYEKRNQIAYITLNRPEKRNAIDTETDDLLFDAWTDFRDDPGVRLAIVTGAGRNRSAPARTWRPTSTAGWKAGPAWAAACSSRGFGGGITRGLHIRQAGHRRAQRLGHRRRH